MRIIDWSSDVCSSYLDAKRHDPSKNRPVDEETRSHPLGLTFLLRLGATLGRRLRLGDSDRLARLQLLQARYDDSITSLQSAAHNTVASLQQIGRASCRERVSQYV